MNPAGIPDDRALSHACVPRFLFDYTDGRWLHRAAQVAVRHGADAIVVSNHGGRQLDGALSAVRALPAILDRLGGAVPVLADGGVRSGLDVLRHVGLGASAVMVDRPWIWGLGARGQAGVAHVLEQLKAELDVAMALTGRTRLA